MKKQKKVVAITKGWCIILAIVGILSLIGTPSLASMVEQSSGQNTTISTGTIVKTNTEQSNAIMTNNHGTPSPDDPWEVTLNFVDSVKNKRDTAVFGEAPDANDGTPPDSYDIPKPGIPPAPYLYTYFDAGMAAPYNRLWVDYKTYPGTLDKIWDLYVKADTGLGGTTDVTITWNKATLATTEYTYIDLYLDSSKIADMIAVNTVTFTVTCGAINHLQIKCHVNQAPVVTDIPDQTIAEGSTFTTISLDAYVSDVDNTDAEMTWTYSGNSQLTVSIVDRVATVTIPNADWNGAETITFKATDPGSLFDDDAATFTVTAVNDPPIANPQSVTTNQDAARVITLTGSDIDGNIAKYTIASLPSHGTLWDTTQITTTPTDLSANTVEYRPNTGYSGGDSFTFTVTDDGTPLPAQTSSPATISITVIQLHQISVKTGWNLISLPVYDTISKTDIIVRYSGTDYSWNNAKGTIVLDSIYNWQRGSIQSYEIVNTLVPGNGYWLWAYHDCDLLIASSASPPTSKHITDLQSKWNIMGLPYETSLPQGSLDIVFSSSHYGWTAATTGADPILLGFIYGWDSGSQLYTLKTTFEPGEGYWMYAYYDCSLNRGD